MGLRAFLFVVYIAISCTGLYKMKISREFADTNFWLGVIFYGTGFVLWLLILRLHPLSFVFPIAAGSLIIGTQLLGAYFLNESLGLTHILGILLIIAGICLIYYGQAS